MTRWCSTPSAPEATQAYVSAKVPTMILCETRGLQLFWVVRGGIGLNRRLGAEFQHSERLITYSILSLEPERRKNRRANTGHETLEDGRATSSEAADKAGFTFAIGLAVGMENFVEPDRRLIQDIRFGP